MFLGIWHSSGESSLQKVSSLYTSEAEALHMNNREDRQKTPVYKKFFCHKDGTSFLQVNVIARVPGWKVDYVSMQRIKDTCHIKLFGSCQDLVNKTNRVCAVSIGSELFDFYKRLSLRRRGRRISRDKYV